MITFYNNKIFIYNLLNKNMMAINIIKFTYTYKYYIY